MPYKLLMRRFFEFFLWEGSSNSSNFQHLYKASEIKKALDVYTRFKSFRKTAKITGISKTTVHRWYHQFHFLIMNRKKIQKYKKKRRSNVKYPELESFIKGLFQEKQLRYYTLSIIQNLYEKRR
jgi:transposase